MLKKLKKEINEDYNHIVMDSERDELFTSLNKIISPLDIPESKKNFIFKHLKRYHKYCVKDYNIRNEKIIDKITQFYNDGGKDKNISLIMNYLDENLIKDMYGKKAHKVYVSLKDDVSRDKFYNGIQAIEKNKYISSVEIVKRKEKYIDSYFKNLHLKSY